MLLLLTAVAAAILASLLALIRTIDGLTIKSVALLLASLAPIAYVVVRFAMNSVPAGYGP